MSFARVRALVVVGVLAVAAVVFVIVALVRDSQQGAVAGGCPRGSVMANVTLPDSPTEVTIKVYNGTDTAGLGENVTEAFANRSFKTQKPAENKRKFKGVAQLRYGPQAVGAAHLLKAYFLARAEPHYDPKRKGTVVDVPRQLTAAELMDRVAEPRRELPELDTPSAEEQDPPVRRVAP